MNQFSGHWDVGTLGTFCKLLIISNFMVKLPVNPPGNFPVLIRAFCSKILSGERLNHSPREPHVERGVRCARLAQ